MRKTMRFKGVCSNFGYRPEAVLVARPWRHAAKQSLNRIERQW